MRNKIALAFLLAGIAPASAHVTLAQSNAMAGSHFVATFRVGHGCSGSPTTALRIEIPEGVAMASPQPKPGWTLSIDHDKDKGRVTAITWTGGPLPADEFDEFAIMLKLPDTAGKLDLPATQSCAVGEEHWDGNDKDHPVPELVVLPKDAMDMMPGMQM